MSATSLRNRHVDGAPVVKRRSDEPFGALTLLRSRSQLLPRLLPADRAQSAISAVARPATGAPTRENPIKAV